MPDSMMYALAVFSALLAALQCWINYSRRKAEVSKEDQTNLEKHIEQVRSEVRRGQEALEDRQDDMNSRVRRLENVQMTETKVQSMLDTKVQPLSESISKLETEIKSVSSDIHRGQGEMNKYIMQIIEELSYLRGSLEARRKDDARRD